MAKEDNKIENAPIEVEEIKPHRKIEKRRMSFDVYFQGLLKRDSKVKAHHLAAMKKYAAEKGCIHATEEEFDRIMRLY